MIFGDCNGSEGITQTQYLPATRSFGMTRPNNAPNGPVCGEDIIFNPRFF